MWLIVHFTQDNSVSAVPKSWWKNGYCAWPKKIFKNKNKLIETKQKPNKIDFEYFEARLLTENPIASYNEAKYKALKAQSTSDLSTTENIKLKFKTKKKKNHKNSKKSPVSEYSSAPEFSDSSSNGVIDDSDEDKLYVPGCSKMIGNKYNFSPTSNNIMGDVSKITMKSYSNNKILEGPRFCNINGIGQDIELISNKISNKEDDIAIINSPSGKWKVQSNDVSATPKAPLTKQLSNIKKCLFPQNNIGDEIYSNTDIPTKTNFMENDITINDNLSISELEISGTDLCLKKMSHLAHEYKLCYDYTKTSLTNIKFDIKNLVYTVNEIKSMMEHVVNVLNTSGSLNNQDSRSSSNILNTENVPIRNVQTLEIVETELENDAMRSQVVIELFRLIGKSISDSVRRMMQKLYDDTWLKYYSYVGHKGKNKLSSLSSCKIIFDAIHLYPKFEKVPDMEIALAISKWMAQASNRLKKKCNDIAENINQTI